MRKLLALAFMLSGFLFITSCGEDDGDDNPITIGEITIELEDAAEIDNLGTYSTTVDISAEDGLAKLVITKGGAAYADTTFTGEPTEATYDFSYTATAEDEDSNITFEFTVTDVDGDDDSEDLVLRVGEAPVVDKTYTVESADEVRGDDESPVDYPQNLVTGVINEDITFTKDKVWVLNGRVVVDAGATLTIEPGTIIKGTEGQGALSSVLLVASGATIIAQGTAEEPIVFTSIEDNINVAGMDYWDGSAVVADGDGFTSTLDVDVDRGQWGGLIILGDAPISADAETTAIEGIPSNVPQAVYGGSDAEDNSGIVEYVSIRFTGTQLSPGNELQGLTLGGVGSGTTINHVESIASADDGIEIFGGTVNITNFVVWGQDDDGYDADQAWTGSVDNFVYVGGVTPGTAFELDGPEGSATGVGHFMNGSIQGGDGSTGFAIDLRDAAAYTFSDIYFFDFQSGEFYVNFADDESLAYYTNGTTTFTNLEFSNELGASLEAFVSVLDANEDAIAADATTQASFAGDANLVSAATVGADLSVFGWTYTSAKNKLDAFPN